MKIEIQSVHFQAQDDLKEFINLHVGKLGQFSDNIIETEVTLKLDNDSAHRENKVVGVKVKVPGNDLFAHSQANSFEAAVQDVVDKLKKQLIKFKEKNVAHR